MKKNIFYLYFAAVASLTALVSCDRTTDMVPGTPEDSRALVSDIAPLNDAAGADESAYLSKLTVKKNFAAGDEIGFFSDGGNIDKTSPDGSEGFANFKLTHNGSGFDSDDFNKDIGRLGYFFGYYPYMQGMESEEGVSVYEDEDQKKVRDLLTMNNSGKNDDFYTGTGNSVSFFHTFALIQIKRGDGFKTFDGDVYLQFKKMVKNVRIDWKNRTEQTRPYTSVILKYDDTKVQAEERRLPTFRIENGEGPIWEAIVPCIPIGWEYGEDAKAGGVTLEAVVLEEKDGDRTVTVIPVDNYKTFLTSYSSGQAHGIRGGSIFTLNIKKVGTDIGVFPAEVAEWGDEQIEATMKGGIASVEDYQSFVATYNTLFSKESYEENEILGIVNDSEELKKYGTNVGNKFTVFLTADLDFSGSEFDKPGQAGARIDNLVIPFDGRGHTISDIRMTGGFCGNLTASLKNLHFGNVYVIQPQGNSDPIGLLADKMSGTATIENCSVENGWLQGNDKVGAAVGTMDGGSIKGCSFSGTMIGTSSEQDNLVGNYQSGNHSDNSNNMIKNIEN